MRIKRIKAAVVAVTIVLAFAIGVVVPTMAAPQGAQVAQEVPDLSDALAQLATGAGAFAVGGVISLLLEQRAPWFQKFGSDTKWAIVFGGSVALSVAARLVITYVPEQALIALEPYWKIIAGAMVLWLGSQATHLLSQIAKRLSGDLLEPTIIGVGGNEVESEE